MIDRNCLNDILTNYNTGIEYEIALFYRLCKACNLDTGQLIRHISRRSDADKIISISRYSNPSLILNLLSEKGLVLRDVSLETQNDNIGPADIVLSVTDAGNNAFPLGLSVKFRNTCTFNVTGRRFLTGTQISTLKKQLEDYTLSYIREMKKEWGDVGNWFHKRRTGTVTDKYIDLIRDAVILNWPNIKDKSQLVASLYHKDSPIKFWVVKYSNRSYSVNPDPVFVNPENVNDIKVRKFHTSYIAFYLNDIKIGHMQVKFNNGFIEKCKKKHPDFVVDNIPMSYGHPFSSWNFSVEE